MKGLFASYQSFWKLPNNFLDGESLPDGRHGCKVVYPSGEGTNIKPYRFGRYTIFMETGEDSIAQVLQPLMVFTDQNSGETAAVAGLTDEDVLSLPFDLNSIFETYQYERYAKANKQAFALEKARQLYYTLRPFIPRAVQIKFRQSIVPLQSKTAFPDWPLDLSQDELYQEVLNMMLQASGNATIPFIWFWPDNYGYAVILTHDVETDLGIRNIPRIVELEKKYGFRSLWNFVPERYKFEPLLLQDLQAEGFEIGVHGLYHDGHLFDSYSQFLKRAERINGYLEEWNCVGFRAPSALRKLDWISKHITAQYDSSCPTTEVHVPQPGGCCSVFPYFIGSMVELPFTLPQDHTIFVILKGKDENIWFDITSQIISKNGLVNIVVHPDYIDDNNNFQIYEKYLSWLQKQGNGWHTLPKDVAQWWRTRNNLQLVYEKNGWKVTGENAHLASIAEAMVTSNGLKHKRHSIGE